MISKAIKMLKDQWVMALWWGYVVMVSLWLLSFTFRALLEAIGV
jgi:hypothetical protein